MRPAPPRRLVRDPGSRRSRARFWWTWKLLFPTARSAVPEPILERFPGAREASFTQGSPIPGWVAWWGIIGEIPSDIPVSIYGVPTGAVDAATEGQADAVDAVSSPVRSRFFSFADLRVSVKVLTAVAVAGIVALAVGVTGLVALGRASGSAQRIYSENLR